jgi:hypothetical protein
MRHKWELQPGDSRLRPTSTTKTYRCERCGASLSVPALQGKGGFAAAAKRAGMSMDCRKEIVKGIMEK